jgi:(R,R)-butanediol dehydrogenase/meso-butanediol dehydrogenase/diacetyl reductase
VGLAVAAWARHCGAREVVVSDFVAGRRKLAGAYGATGVIDPGKQELGPSFEKLAGGPPDVIFECVGLPGLIQECVTLAAPHSRIVVAGACMQPDTIVPVVAVLKQLSIHFVSCYHVTDFAVTLEMLESGRLEGSAMITDRVSLDALPEMFEALKKPTTQCKVIVEP